jgi:hypothetical protein
MARNDPQMKLRLPAELKAKIDEQAHAAGRSINAEIVQRLEGSFEPPPDLDRLEFVAAQAAQRSLMTFLRAMIANAERREMPPESVVETLKWMLPKEGE